ncbi:MAG: EAL domain-containing protein [Methylococcales bacterium]|nr:EAL domain-containing protein [Methylococcales bacterium]
MNQNVFNEQHLEYSLLNTSINELVEALFAANKKLAFQNEEKAQLDAELVIAIKKLAFQNEEKEKRAAELVIANKELAFQNEEKAQLAAELLIANKELAFQNAEKEKRAAELLIANKELAFQNHEKEQRALELIKINDELRIAATVFESQEGMMVTDANTLILRVNSAFEHINGYSSGEIIGKTPKLLQSGLHHADFYAAMWESIHHTGHWKGEIYNQAKSGDIYPEYLTITAVHDNKGVVTNYVATFTDIRITKLALEEVERLAFYDPLTGLPNRRLLRERLKLVFATNHRNGEHAALLFLDIDHFKILNDTLGHNVGDLLLQQVAQRLNSCVHEVDTVARLGGDEFVVLLTELSEEALEAAAQADVIGHKILKLLNEPYLLSTQDYLSSSSIGVTVFNNNRQEIDELIKQADIAMYAAKFSGRNALCFFDPQMQISINARVLLEADLRQALAENQFELYYQAQSTHDGRIIGAEALIRWQHPQQGLMFPDAFIPLAEEVGLITAIGQWVLQTTCSQLKNWENNTHTQHLQLAVNVSVRQFHQADFVSQVQQILSDTGINPARLKLELTESLVIDNVNDTIVKMNTLKKMGVHFSMDDFGTGFSSLSYLTSLPFNQLKIDKSFVQNIDIKPSDMVIIQTIIGMVHNLDMEVIAEGVETEEQRAFLEDNNCPLCQGYLFSKPVPIAQFEALLVTHIQ